MDDVIQQIRALGARRKRQRDELQATDSELFALVPAARLRCTAEEIRGMTGLSLATIRRYTTGN
jgi:hypothetical protein